MKQRLSTSVLFVLGLLLGSVLMPPLEAQQPVTVSGSVTIDTGSLEDAVAGSGWDGFPILAVRQDSQSALAADGDFIPITIDSSGGLRVSIVAGAGTGGTALADDADFADGVTSGTPIGGVAEFAAPTTVTEGDFGWAAITLNRALKVTLYNSSGTELTADTQATHATTLGTITSVTGGVLMGNASTATPTDVGADGDAAIIWLTRNGAVNIADGGGSITVDASNLDVQSGGGDLVLDTTITTIFGSDAIFGTAGTADTDVLSVQGIASMTPLLVNPGTATLWGVYVEDAAETAGANLMMAGSVRRDAASSSAGTTGDNATINTDGSGLLWTRDIDPCSAGTKQYLPISVSSATTTELTASLAGASTYYYVCALNLVTAAANNVALADDDTDNCASVTSGLAGGTTAASGWNFGANGGLTLGNGASSVMRSQGTNRVLCLVTSAATQLSGQIVVVAAP